MPKRYKAQLNHIGFDWFYQSNRILDALLAREIRVLSKLGFYKEYGDLDDPTFTGHCESIALMEAISGILSVAASIVMDAGFKAPNQIIATLVAVVMDPSLILTHTLEPEAFGMIARCYQRADEPAGTFWFDIERLANSPVPDLEQVRAAAFRAIALLRDQASPGRRPDKAIEYLALKLKEIFLRYNDTITRHSVLSRRDGKDIQIERGPFVKFLEEVLAPLNSFLKSLPKDYGAKPISAGAIAEYIRGRGDKQSPQSTATALLERMPHSAHIFHREVCCPVVFSRRIKTRFTTPTEKANDRDLHGRIPAAKP
jgi:hypothetical protein